MSEIFGMRCVQMSENEAAYNGAQVIISPLSDCSLSDNREGVIFVHLLIIHWVRVILHTVKYLVAPWGSGEPRGVVNVISNTRGEDNISWESWV